jgi:hypothetical protein
MKVLLFANTDWYLYNFRLAQALALRERGDEVVLVSPDGSYGPRMQDLGIRWLPFPLARRSLNPFEGIQTVLRLLKLYRHPSSCQLGDRPGLCFYGGRSSARMVERFYQAILPVGVKKYLGYLSKPG